MTGMRNSAANNNFMVCEPPGARKDSPADAHPRQARSWRLPVGTVTRKQPLRDLGKTPARARSVALQNPDQIEPVIWPMDGADRQLASDFPDQPWNGAMVPGDQRRGWRRDHHRRQRRLFLFRIRMIDR